MKKKLIVSGRYYTIDHSLPTMVKSVIQSVIQTTCCVLVTVVGIEDIMVNRADENPAFRALSLIGWGRNIIGKQDNFR